MTNKPHTIEDSIKVKDARLTKNLLRKGNLNSEYKRGPSHTAQIFEHPQEYKDSLNSVMICGIEKYILEYQRKYSFRTFKRSHKEGVSKLLKTPSTLNNGRVY